MHQLLSVIFPYRPSHRFYFGALPSARVRFLTHAVRRTLCLPLLIMAVGILTLTLTATASLHVHKDARHSDLWFHFYDDLPRVWKTPRPILLREFSPHDMERLVASLGGEDVDRSDNSVVDGCYQNDGSEENGAPIITLCDTLRGDQAGLVFTHEYAHFAWDEMLNDEQRARYTRLWRVQKRTHHLVTEYAEESEEEAFADSFAYFVRRPALLQKKDAASAQFLRDLSTARANSPNSANSPNITE
jgi:hypothetical protein